MSTAFESLIPAYAAKQRWFAGHHAERVQIVDRETFRSDAPTLDWVLADIDGSHYQLVVGGRPAGSFPEFLAGHDHSVLGEADGMLWYDAVLDSELALTLLRVFTDGGEWAERVRPIGVEQSNTSLVYDDRIIGKLFRRLHLGPNLDVEVTNALASAGFPHVAEPVATWTRHGNDLAFVQRFLAGGAEGWALALTSVRDLLGSEPDTDPAEAGGDFSFEAGRLGRVTAEMHLAMAKAFGSSPGDAGAWAGGMRDSLHILEPDERAAAEGVIARLEQVGDPGHAVRVHGDYHLGQTMRTDDGWFVLDFEGEPARPLEERQRATSPLKDVTGMLRSFDYAARSGLAERDGASAACEELADAWADRNRGAFLAGYLATSGVDALLPGDDGSLDAVMAAFELEKAVYELGYERAYRPGWVEIPQRAIRRLVGQ